MVRYQVNILHRATILFILFVPAFPELKLTCAQTNEKPDQNLLDLNSATNLAISNHPDIRKIGWLEDKALADGFQQSRLVNPQFGSTANEIGNDGQGGQYGFFLQRNLVRNNRVEQIQNAADWEARSLKSRSLIIQRKVAFETAQSFVQIEFLERKNDLTEKKLTELRKIKKIAEDLMKGGEVAPVDLLRLDIEVSQTLLQSKKLKTTRQRFMSLLKLSTGSAELPKLDFNFDQEVNLVLHSSKEREVDWDSHPSIRQLTDLIEAKKWRFQVANARQTPDWQLQTSVNYDTGTEDIFGGFQLNIPWMVNDRKTGLIGSAAADVQILNETRNATRRKLEQKWINLSSRREGLIAEITNLDTVVIPQTDQISQQTIALFHAGETDHKAVKEAVMMGYNRREKRLDLAQQLLLVEIESETLTVE